MNSALSTSHRLCYLTPLTLFCYLPKEAEWPISEKVSATIVFCQSDIEVLDSILTLHPTIAGQDSSKVLEYFSKNGARCPPDTNPAEHIVEVIQGKSQQKDVDWVDVWNKSEERRVAIEQLETLNRENIARPRTDEAESDYATSHWFQFCMVSKRLMVQLWRSPVSLGRVLSNQNHFLTLIFDRITCGIKLFSTYLQLFLAGSRFGTWAIAASICSSVFLRFSILFSLRQAA